MLDPSNDRIARIDLHKNQLGDEGVRILMKAISRSKTVVHLNVASNEIGNEGMIEIFKTLKRNHSLISLNVATLEGMSRNRISQSGYHVLRDFLKVNKCLNILDVSSIGLGNEGMMSLCDAFLDEELEQNSDSHQSTPTSCQLLSLRC